MTRSDHEIAVSPATLTEIPTRIPERRPPPKAICILLPVWGDDYIDQFLDRSLLTLLAPGNIPALAKALPTRFVFLTRARDAEKIRSHPSLLGLRSLTEVDFLPIDDLITSGNHSTTVTLAYTRAVRQCGEAMLDTCFFFLVSDYIMADGSLTAVLERMQAGFSAVQVGNFQLDSDVAEMWLQERIASAKTSLALAPREVMTWALGCLHPLSAANIINFPLCYNTNANRLLWYIDDNTLIGRFYLLHMICIRPETVDFIIGSSCDYSFVPEMCPSGNTVTITDSDDYLVVEIQPHGHESQFLHLGPGSIEGLAASLSEWTTAGHRANAQDTIVFHASALPAILPQAIAEADEFIRNLTPHLASMPQPCRNHPYWLGAIAAFERAVAQRDSGVTDASLPITVRVVRWVQTRFVGQPPEVTRAHPRWLDFQAPLAACKELIAGGAHLLIGSSRSVPMIDWLRDQVPDAATFSLRQLMANRTIRAVNEGSIDAAFIELVDDYVTHMNDIVRRIAPLLRPNGEIIFVAFNINWSRNADHMSRAFAAGLASLVRSKPWPDEVITSTTSRFRWRLNGACIHASAALFQRPTLGWPLHLVRAALLLPLAMIVNIVSSLRVRSFADGSIPTSIFVRLRVNCDVALTRDSRQGAATRASPSPVRQSDGVKA